jgi:two-component system response regulator MprA
MVRDLLAELGHAAVEASNGLEAVAACERERPDLLILDLLMPRLSGLDALERLRAKGIRAPAILLSAISDGSVRGLDGAEKVDVLLEKPVTTDTLARAISRATRAGGAP